MPLKESRSPGRRPLSFVLMLLSLLGCAGASASPSAPGRIEIELPAGPLQQAIEQLADIAGLQILYDPDLLRRYATRGLHGTFTPGNALERLLADTDITFVFTASDAVALHARAKPDTMPAQAGTDVSSQVRTVTVTADRNRRLTYDSAPNVSSVKLDEPSLVVPVASASLPQQFLRDQKATRLDDIVEFISGTETVPDGESSSAFELRGFPTYQYYLDGVRVSPDLHHDGFRDFANVDRIDIVKGPTSLLYGRTEPGGLINIITKKPLEQSLLALEQQIGSFDYKRTQLDAGGPLTASGALLYRFNAAWEKSGSFRDIPQNRRIFVAPVMTWRIDEATDVTPYLEYLNSHDPSDSGQPVMGDRLPLVPTSRSLDEGGEIHTSDLRIGMEASHIFADGWTAHAHVDARWLHAPQTPQIALASDGLAAIQCHPDVCPVARQLVSIPVAQGYTYYASMDAARDFSLWHTRHSVLLGTDFFETGAYTEWQTTSDFSLTTDLFNPKSIPLPRSLLDNPDQKTHRNSGERWFAVYSQDQVQIGASLYFLIGLRFDQALTRNSQDIYSTAPNFMNGLNFLNSNDRATAHAFKQREGIVWRAQPWLSLYATYAQNFGVTPGIYVGANSQNALSLHQQSAEELEAGAKLGLADDRLNATLAIFSLTKENIAATLLEPALNASGLLFLTGTARNHGLELDVHGELSPEVQLLASYAYIDSRIHNYPESGANELVGSTGNRLFGVPRNGGSLWASYRVPAGPLRGLKLGAGGIARGAREGDNANDYKLPGFVKWNVFASYDWRLRGLQATAQLNVDNIFNKSYYESLSGTRTVMPGYPRRWLASLGLEF